MKLICTKQVAFSSIDQLELDMIIVASGYEQRGTHLAACLNEAANARRLALGFPEHHSLSRTANDKRLIELGYEMIEVGPAPYKTLESRIRLLMESVSGNEVNIFVDYSSMSRDWFGAILQVVRCAFVENLRVNIYFGYSHSAYSLPLPSPANVKIAPIRGFATMELPRRPTALVIGLGFEAQKALGVREYVDPAETYIFYTDPASDDRFVEAITQNNKDLWRLVPAKNRFTYPAEDLAKCSELLSGLCLGLSGRYRTILAPLGPKPFSLLCMLISMRLPGVEVWRVSSGSLRPPTEQIATGKTSVVKVTFAQP